MKKLLTLLFSAMVVFSLAIPVIAQDGNAESQPTSKPKKDKKEQKAKKADKKNKMTDLK